MVYINVQLGIMYCSSLWSPSSSDVSRHLWRLPWQPQASPRDICSDEFSFLHLHCTLHSSYNAPLSKMHSVEIICLCLIYNQ